MIPELGNALSFPLAKTHETLFSPSGEEGRFSVKPMRGQDSKLQNPSGESVWQVMGATLGMISQAHSLIETLEAQLAEKDSKIARLQEQVTKDDLTGILNRRGFMEVFNAELDRTKRGFSAGGLLIMIDLDNFKMINDTYGHQAGDAALRLIGRTLSSDVRAMDATARLGGDEFVLLLANTDRDKALTRAQTLIRRLNSLSMVWYGAEIPIRASLGLRDYTAGDNAETVMNNADQNMYASKRKSKMGR